MTKETKEIKDRLNSNVHQHSLEAERAFEQAEKRIHVDGMWSKWSKQVERGWHATIDVITHEQLTNMRGRGTCAIYRETFPLGQ